MKCLLVIDHFSEIAEIYQQLPSFSPTPTFHGLADDSKICKRFEEVLKFNEKILYGQTNKDHWPFMFFNQFTKSALSSQPRRKRLEISFPLISLFVSVCVSLIS